MIIIDTKFSGLKLFKSNLYNDKRGYLREILKKKNFNKDLIFHYFAKSKKYLKPHFIGVDKNKFVADCEQIEKCINKKTVAIMIPNLIGNIADWRKINRIAKKYNLKIIEDSADTIGYTINKKNTGKFSDITTNSFYASHIINGAGTGGIVCFNDFKKRQIKYNF